MGDVLAAARSQCPPSHQQSAAREAAITDSTALAQRHVQERLKDPGSAMFRNVTFNPTTGSVCGEVNARNSYGGYTGYSYFWLRIVDGSPEGLWIDSGNERLAATLCQGP